VKLRLDNRLIRFKPVYSLSPSRAELQALAESSSGGGELPLLVHRGCRLAFWSFAGIISLCAVDLNGRAYLRAGGLLIERRAQPGPRLPF